MPTGNNAVGVTWKAAALKAGVAGKTASAWADLSEAAAALAKLDAAIAAAQAVCTAKRAVYAGNTFVVKLVPNP